MGFVQARALRKRQEHAKTLVQRRIEKYERQLEKLKAIARELKYADWGDSAERDL